MSVPKELGCSAGKARPRTPPTTRSAFTRTRTSIGPEVDGACSLYCDGMVTNWGAHRNDIALWVVISSEPDG